MHFEIVGTGTPMDGAIGEAFHSNSEGADIFVLGRLVARGVPHRFLSVSDKPQHFPAMVRGQIGLLAKEPSRES